MAAQVESDFTEFFADVEQRLRLSLVAAFGYDVGRDAAADALAWGWQHWDRLQAMDNPVGYLYRVGQSMALKALAREAPAGGDLTTVSAGWEGPEFEPHLAPLLSTLSEQQRVAVWLVHGMGYRHREVAELLGCSIPTIATHVRRGLAKLRVGLEVNLDG